MTIPLMIGGATTSMLHTALKIAPHYSQPVIYAKDATKGVEGAKSLLDKTASTTFVDSIYTEYERVKKVSKDFISPLAPYTTACAKAKSLVFDSTTITKPNFVGTKLIEYTIEELIPYIDWTFFFTAWEMRKKYPDILHDPVIGEEARKLFDEANAFLLKLASDKSLGIKGVISIAPAYSVGDDIVVTHEHGEHRFYTFRQQKENSSYLSLADFIAPKGAVDSNNVPIIDYLAGFAVTAGLGVDELVKSYDEDQDDFHSLLTKVLADRLAEAFAEKVHEDIRTTYWGYAPQEALTKEQLLQAIYQGIRPAFGYPSLIDHSEKVTLFDWLNVEAQTGIILTESYMMSPGASVCGICFAHPKSKYFDVFHVGKDQVENYALRKGITIDDVEKQIRTRIKYND